MKNKWILLIPLLLTLKVIAKQKLSPLQIWDKKYVHELPKQAQQALASGLYYAIKSNGNEQIVGNMVDTFYASSLPRKCKTAYLKACEASCMNRLHNKPWAQSLLPYYSEVIKELNKDKSGNFIIAFGSEQGKKLPTTLFELDRALNPHKQAKTFYAHFQVATPQGTMHIQTQFHS